MKTRFDQATSGSRVATRTEQKRAHAVGAGGAATEWWSSFFDGLWVEAQMRTHDEETTAAESAFLVDALGLQVGHRVLDVPCGIGRHSLNLARMGMHVTGVDRTPQFIHVAEKNSDQLGVAANWIEQDMRQIAWEAEFDAAFCYWGSFGYFDEAENVSFLNKLVAAVKPGGRLLVDTHVYETLMPKLGQRKDWRQLDDMLILEERAFDFKTSRTDTRWTIIRDDEKFENNTSIRLYTYRELTNLFREAGLVDLQAYGSIRKDPFTLESPRLYLTGTRR